MNIIKRNNIKISGTGEKVVLFAHGYGCNQQMWRLITPAFEDKYKVVLIDHVGSGDSDSSFYDKVKYGSLNGYAEDIIEIITELGAQQVCYVGHSVSSMIGVLAANARPDLFEKLILVTPSPCYINKDDYVGGFTKDEIDGLLNSLESNFFDWARAIAPVISGHDVKAGEEIAKSFCANRPDIAKHFAHVTFLSDNRKDLSRLKVPTVIFQCAEDMIAPPKVGEYLKEHIRNSQMFHLNATGHCPHLTHPAEFQQMLHLVM